jgi:hypothetical protein
MHPSCLLVNGIRLLVAGCLQNTQAFVYCLWIEYLPETSSQKPVASG